MIISQNCDGQMASSLRDVGNVKLNVFELSQSSESIEVLSEHENSEDEEFLGYYTVDSDGKKRRSRHPVAWFGGQQSMRLGMKLPV